MITVDELVVVASVGTGRKAVAIGEAGAGPLGEALRAVDQTASAEGKLLAAVAVLAQYEACGRRPRVVGAAAETAAAETLPPCSRRAVEILGQVLAMTNTPTKDHLLGEWLEYAAGAGRRAPWRLLPALLEYGAAHRARREGIARAAGARGAWLMRQNARWRYAAGEAEDLRGLWSTGTREQRLAAIGQLRRGEPDAAREMIASTWKEDAAEDRAAFVGAMAGGLSLADEAFLESALDDRSKQVRAAAVELLARLPGSGLVGRMVARAGPLVRLRAGAARGLLRKAVPASIEVTLPAEKFDPTWARDGVVEKPEGKVGRRQWWLAQVLGAVPPAHWSAAWGMTPAECIAAARDEFADVLLEGWHAAAGRHADEGWAAALLSAAAKDGRGPLTWSLLGTMGADAREAITAEVLEAPRTNFQQVIALLHEAPFGLGRRAAAGLFKQIEYAIDQHDKRGSYYYAVGQVLADVACRVPPGVHDELAGRWVGDKWEQNGKARDEFLRVVGLRRDVRGEFGIVDG